LTSPNGKRGERESLRHRLQKDPLEPLESAARVEQALDQVFPLEPGDARAAGS